MANEDYKLKSGDTIGAEKRGQLNHNQRSKSHKEIDITPMPDILIDNAPGTIAVKVGKGNLVRIACGGQFVTFGASTIAIPSLATANTIECPAAGFITVVAFDDYFRQSIDLRIEVTQD